MGDDERPAASQASAEIADSLERAMTDMSMSDVKDHAFWETQPVAQLKPELDKEMLTRGAPCGAVTVIPPTSISLVKE